MHIRVKGNMGGYVTFHRHIGRGGGGGRFIRGGSLEPPFWPPKDFIHTTNLH